MDKTSYVLRLEIAGAWSAFDFGQLLSDISELYSLRLLFEILQDDYRELDRFAYEISPFPSARRRLLYRYLAGLPTGFGFAGALFPIDEQGLSRLSELLDQNERITIRELQYASPGFADLTGIGTAARSVFDFIRWVVEFRDAKASRAHDDERKSLENDAMRIRNARDFLAGVRELGTTETEFRRLVHLVDAKQEALLRAVEDGRLVNVIIRELEE